MRASPQTQPNTNQSNTVSSGNCMHLSSLSVLPVGGSLGRAREERCWWGWRGSSAKGRHQQGGTIGLTASCAYLYTASNGGTTKDSHRTPTQKGHAFAATQSHPFSPVRPEERTFPASTTFQIPTSNRYRVGKGGHSVGTTIIELVWRKLQRESVLQKSES